MPPECTYTALHRKPINTCSSIRSVGSAVQAIDQNLFLIYHETQRAQRKKNSRMLFNFVSWSPGVKK
jgi:hypothetical protein